MDPGYFALVMASGILSVGMRLNGFVALSVLLLTVCAVAFVTLVVLTGWRLAWCRDAVIGDVVNPARGFGFFTFIAGTNVLGVRLAMDGLYLVTAVLLVVAGLTWLVLGYGSWAAVLGRAQHPVVASANGSWFVWVVAGQSVAVSAASLESVFTSWRDVLAVLAVFAWSVGSSCMPRSGSSWPRE